MARVERGNASGYLRKLRIEKLSRRLVAQDAAAQEHGTSHRQLQPTVDELLTINAGARPTKVWPTVGVAPGASRH